MNIVIFDNVGADALAGYLRELGHSPVPITGLDGQRARDIHGRYDLAIVDIRMRNDSDETDTSGLEFGIELSALGTPTILRTSYTPSSDRLFDLIWTGAVTGVGLAPIFDTTS